MECINLWWKFFFRILPSYFYTILPKEGNLMNLFKTKSLSSFQEDVKKQNLKKNMGAMDMLLLSESGVSWELASLYSQGLSQPNSSPGIVVSFLLSAIACVFCALCYSEMASTVPFAKVLHLFLCNVRWIDGLDRRVESSLGIFPAASLVAAGWSAYTTGLSIGWYRSPKSFYRRCRRWGNHERYQQC